MNELGRRSSGTPPYWLPGTQVMWREGSGPLGTGEPVHDASLPHFATPVTVVRDDAEGLVVWLRTGTPVLRAARADGRDKRADRGTLFTAAVVQERGAHALYDQVRVVPTGRSWSVWAFFAEGTGEFAGWYVNLERPHVRDAGAVYTSDHVLDLWVGPDRVGSERTRTSSSSPSPRARSTAPRRPRSRRTASRSKPLWPRGPHPSAKGGRPSHLTLRGRSLTYRRSEPITTVRGMGYRFET